MTDLKTLREVAERAQADSTEEAMNEFCAVFNLPACLSLLDRIEELEGALDAIDDSARRAVLLRGPSHYRLAVENIMLRLAALKDTPNG